MEPYVGLTLSSSLLFAIGNVFQKRGIPAGLGLRSVRALLARPLQLFAHLLRSPLWILGLVLTVLAVALETQALGGGDVSVVKPLSRIQSVFVLVIGVALLGERLLPLEWLGVFALLAGAFLLGLQPGDELAHVPSAAARWASAFGVLGVGVGLALLADWRRSRLPPELALALAAGCLFGLGDVMMKIGTELARDGAGHFDLASRAGAGGLVATGEFRLAVAATAAAFVLQQLAFARGRVGLVVPVIGVGGTLLTVLLGSGLLREPIGAERLLGITVVVLGTALLSARESRPPASPQLPAPQR